MNSASPGEHGVPRGTPPEPLRPGALRWSTGPRDSGTAARAASPGERPSRGAVALDYEAAGVSIEAGDRAVALMRDAIARTSGPEVVGGIGGFAGLYDASRLTG